jgi:hypothetical protein
VRERVKAGVRLMGLLEDLYNSPFGCLVERVVVNTCTTKGKFQRFSFKAVVLCYVRVLISRYLGWYWKRSNVLLDMKTPYLQLSGSSAETESTLNAVMYLVEPPQPPLWPASRNLSKVKSD